MKDIIDRSVSVAIVWHLMPESRPIEIVSGNIKNLTGYLDDDFLTGRIKWVDITHPDDISRLEIEVNQFLERGIRRWTQEYRLITKSGDIKWFSDDNHALENSNGQVTKIQAIIRDITDYKNPEAQKAELEAQNKNLQKAESLGRMAGAIAQHFNSQLSVVMGNLEMAICDLQGNKSVTNFIEQALKAAKRSSEISRLMLTYLGQIVGKREANDLSTVCHAHFLGIQETLPQNIVFENQFMDFGPIICTSEKNIQQILGHLITNALEAIDDHPGKIEIKTRIIPAADISRIRLMPADWECSSKFFADLEITDNGCGIKHEDMDKIFDPFFTTKFTGRGLGLAVVLGIIRAHGGAIQVESDIEKGSSFHAFFPLEPDEIEI